MIIGTLIKRSASLGFLVIYLIMPSCNKHIPSRIIKPGYENVYKWRLDAAGCLNIRDSFMFKSIFDDLNLKNMHKDNVIELLGEPNNVYIRDMDIIKKYPNEMYVMTYFMQSDCIIGRSGNFCIEGKDQSILLIFDNRGVFFKYLIEEYDYH